MKHLPRTITKNIKEILKASRFWRKLFFFKRLSPKQKLYFELILGTFLVLFMPFVITNVLFPKKASAVWHDDNFQYRVPVTINNSGAADADKRVRITVDTSTLITNSKMQSNCADARFTDINGKKLQYVLQGRCNTTTTIYYVLVPTIYGSGDTILYHYYGSPAAESQSVYPMFSQSEFSPTSVVIGTEEKANSPIAYWRFDEGVGNLTRNNPSADTTTGLVAYYPMDESSWSGKCNVADAINDAKDIVGSNHAWSCPNPSGPTTTSSGKYGYGGSFDGTNDYLDTRATASMLGIDKATNPFSISAWFKTNQDGEYYLFDNYDAVGNHDISLRVDAGKIETYIVDDANNNNGAPQYGSGLSDDNWHHVILTWNGSGTEKVYVDGRLIGTTNSPSVRGSFESGTGFWIGQRPSAAAYFPGTLDEVRVYSKELNFTQISSLYNNGPEGTLSGATKPTWQQEDQCISGKCLFFDGASSYLLTPHTSQTDFSGTRAFTIQSWIKPTSLSGVIASKFDAGVAGQWVFSISSGQLVLHREVSPYTITGNTTMETNKWYHVSAVYDGTNMQLFVNGKPDSYLKASGSISSDTNNVLIGASYTSSSPSNFFNGSIDEVKIFNSAKSASQIAADYASRGSTKAVGSVFGASTQNNPAALSNGLVGHWKMDEDSWTNNCSTDTVFDSSGNGTNGDACPNSTGPTGAAAGKFGRGGSFDGSNDYINLGTLTTYTNGTLAMWINRNSGAQDAGDSGVGAFFGRQRDGHSSNLIFDFDDNTNFRARFSLGGAYGGNKVTSISTIPAQTWTHVAATWEGTTVKIFVNGKFEGSINDATADQGGAAVTIGAAISGWAGYFAGKMDDVRMYKRTLSDAEISQLANWAAGPVAYWKFDEGAGTTAFDSGTASASGAISKATYVPGKFGKALQFNGIDSAVTVATSSALNDMDDGAGISISAWIKPQSAGTSNVGRIIGKSGAASENGWVLGMNSAGFAFQRTTFTGSPSTLLCVTNGRAFNEFGHWVHVGVTWNGSSDCTGVQFYVNGAPLGNFVSSQATGTSISDGLQPVVIGNRVNLNRTFDGNIDELRVYNYQRSARQIVEDMNGGHPAPGSPVSSPIVHYKFDEGFGTTANNSGSVATISGTLTNMSSPATPVSGWNLGGKFNKALSFDGTNDYVNIPHTPQVNFRKDDDFAISLWAKIPTAQLDTASTDNALIEKWDGANGYPYVIRFRNQTHGTTPNAIRVARYDGTNNPGITTSDTYNDNSWHHIVFTKIGSTLYLYVDGRIKGTTTDTTTTNTENLSNVYIGERGTPSNRFFGLIDELKIFNGGMTEEQVKLDYNRGAAQVMGALSTDSDGKTASNSASREYCVPGDTSSTCSPPVGEWKFEEGSGTTAYDTSGNANTGTLTSGPYYTTGKKGKAVFFDGSDDYITVPSFNINSQLSISAWVKLNSFGSGLDQDLIIRKGTTFGATNNVWLLDIQDSKILFIPKDSTTTSSGGTACTGAENCVIGSTNLSTNTWYYIVGTYDGSTMKVYLNGILDGSKASSDGVANSSNTINIGGRPDAADMTNGSIDQIRLYNYALSASQIAWEYNQGKPVAHWKMDECQGSTINDSSGRSNSGTLTIGGSAPQTSIGTCTTSGARYNGITGKKNYSMSFDGVDDYVSIGSRSDLQFNYNQDFSGSAWVYINSLTGFNHIFSQTSSANRFYYSMSTDSGLNKLNVGIGKSSVGANVVNSISTITYGRWYHMVMTYTGTSTQILSLYVDGTLQGTTTYSFGALSAPDQGFYIGYDNSGIGTRYLDGKIDDMKMFNYVLTPTQVKTLYNDGAVKFGPATGAP